MPHFPSLPGFKPNSGESTSLTAKNLRQHNEDFLAEKVKYLEAKNKVQAAEIEELRQKLAVAAVASVVDETETPVSNVPAQASKTTQDSARDSSAWCSTANLDCF